MTSTTGQVPAGERVEAVRQAASEITAKYDRTYWLGCAREGRRATELLRALGESGLLGLGVPEDLGGQGGGMSEIVALVESLGRAGLPSYGFLIANFSRTAVLKFGSPEQIDRFVRPTLTGVGTTCFALTEPDAGTNSFALRTRADQVPDGWRVNGQKVFISAAAEADQMLLVARTSPASAETRTSGLSLFIVDLPASGVTTEPMNIRAAETESQYTVYFDDVLIPPDALVGEIGQADRYLFSALNPERTIGAAMSVGLGCYALAKGVAYAKDRAPFGKPVGSYQAVQHPFARAHINLMAARLLTYQAATEIDQGSPAGASANAAKYLASEAASAALDATIQVHGGYAFDRDFDVISLYEPLRLFRIAPIHNDQVLNYIAQHELKLPRGY